MCPRLLRIGQCIITNVACLNHGRSLHFGSTLSKWEIPLFKAKVNPTIATSAFMEFYAGSAEQMGAFVA